MKERDCHIWEWINGKSFSGSLLSSFGGYSYRLLGTLPQFSLDTDLWSGQPVSLFSWAWSQSGSSKPSSKSPFRTKKSYLYITSQMVCQELSLALQVLYYPLTAVQQLSVDLLKKQIWHQTALYTVSTRNLLWKQEEKAHLVPSPPSRSHKTSLFSFHCVV